VRDVLPKDGASKLPVNSELRVLYVGTLQPSLEGNDCDIDLTRLRLLSDDGVSRELHGSFESSADGAWLVAKTEESLAPDSTYQLQLELGADAEPCSCEERQWTTVSTFSTGANADLERPLFYGVKSISYGPLGEFFQGCSLFKGLYGSPEIDAATDSSSGIRYNLYIDGAVSRQFLEEDSAHGASLDFFVFCPVQGSTEGLVPQPGAKIEVRAIDIAGNESLPTDPLEVTAGCEPPASSAADPGNSPDNSNTAPTAIVHSQSGLKGIDPAADNDSGCSIRLSGSSESPAVSWLVAPLFIALQARVRSGTARERGLRRAKQ
jgi:hypothetical protein